MPAAATAEPITATAKPVPLDSSDASRDKAGGRNNQGSLRLRSGASGFSGNGVSLDGTWLITVSNSGRRLAGKGDGDVEDIARLGGPSLVAFERRQRILSYGP